MTIVHYCCCSVACNFDMSSTTHPLLAVNVKNWFKLHSLFNFKFSAIYLSFYQYHICNKRAWIKIVWLTKFNSNAEFQILYGGRVENVS
jgi:hypothetical protein